MLLLRCFKRKGMTYLMIKKLTAAMLSLAVLGTSAFAADWRREYPWAEKGIEYCIENEILQGAPDGDLMLADNMTRAQMAKILTVAFDLKGEGEFEFSDVSEDDWEYDYVYALSRYMPDKQSEFNGNEKVTREEFAATLVRASGLNTGNIRNSGILKANFSDASEVSDKYKTLLSIAVERAYMKGSDGKILPKNLLTRAEVCTFIRRVAADKDSLTWEDLGVESSYTALIGEAEISCESAQKWAADKGAAQIFIDIAPIYWKYGEISGLRPEILYAQAAKETGFGKYTGAVKPEMNNWAGIKIKSPVGDRTEDHETFATPDDGVRAHFNHMGAYVGLKPIGEAHDRYYVVSSISWAGSVKNLEALGGRWCPDLYYGYSILRDLLNPMMEYAE